MGGICHHPLNLGLGVDSRHSQGRGCMMTVVTISSSSVASITPRSTLLDTIILRTEGCHRDTVNILSLHLPPSLGELLSQTSPGTVAACWLGQMAGTGFKFKQIKHRQDHPVGRQEGSISARCCSLRMALLILASVIWLHGIVTLRLMRYSYLPAF